MIKIYFLFLLMFLISCNSNSPSASDNYNKVVDDAYESFKARIASDSFDVAAESDAKYVAGFHYDTVKQNEAKEWLSKLEVHKKTNNEKAESIRMGNQLFLKKNLKLGLILYKDEHCNFLQEHILMKAYPKDKDSLTKAVQILTDSIWRSIPFDDNCIKNIRCGVYLYTKEQDFQLNGWRKWYVMGSKISGEDVNVRF